jgi:predicted aspartyl protease
VAAIVSSAGEQGTPSEPIIPPVGVFYVPIEVADLQGTRFEPLTALVDTGASYLSVPAPLLESLTVRCLEERSFKLGDGRTVDYDVGTVLLRMDGRAFPTMCVFGDPESQPVLGAVAMETFGLGPDPINQRLVPIPNLLMTAPRHGE